MHKKIEYVAFKKYSNTDEISQFNNTKKYLEYNYIELELELE